MGKTIITFDSVTYALKARKLLTKAGINAKIVKISGELSKGCTHGVEIYPNTFFDSISILKQSEIDYSVYNG
ncbi:MAG: DUF3343 domain-containing protein [Ruminococcaceae bacterium]|nr:DUF3343 domain-containing protein [Oscillospiraceae bacterium]